VVTEIAGDVAVHAIEQNLTAENLQAA